MRIHSLIRAAHQLLDADSLLSQQASVHAHRLPQPPSGPYVRLVIRQLQTPLDEHATGTLAIPVQVLVECRQHPDPDLALEATHGSVERILAGAKLTTSFGEVFVPISRHSRGPVLTQDDIYTQTNTYLFIGQ